MRYIKYINLSFYWQWTYSIINYINKRKVFVFMLNVTLLSSYVYCPRKFFLINVLGFKEPLKKEMVIGSIVHKILDLTNKQEKKIISGFDSSIGLKEIETSFVKAYKRIIFYVFNKEKEKFASFGIDKKELFDKIDSFLLEETKRRAKKVFEFIKDKKEIFPKIETEVFVGSKNLGLKGYIDRIEIYPDYVILFDIKTGKSKKGELWKEERIQLGAYYLLLKELGKNVKNAYIMHLNREKTALNFNVFLEHEIKEIIEEVKFVLKNKKIPKPLKNKSKCEKCALRNICFNERLIDEKIKNSL